MGRTLFSFEALRVEHTCLSKAENGSGIALAQESNDNALGHVLPQHLCCQGTCNNWTCFLYVTSLALTNLSANNDPSGHFHDGLFIVQAWPGLCLGSLRVSLASCPTPIGALPRKV